MSKKKITGCSQVSLCLGASVPEERQVASLFLDKTLCSPLISKVFAIMKHNFRCLQHNTMYIIVIKSEKNNHEYIYSCRYVFYPSDKVLENCENDP